MFKYNHMSIYLEFIYEVRNFFLITRKKILINKNSFGQRN